MLLSLVPKRDRYFQRCQTGDTACAMSKHSSSSFVMTISPPFGFEYFSGFRCMWSHAMAWSRRCRYPICQSRRSSGPNPLAVLRHPSGPIFSIFDEISFIGSSTALSIFALVIVWTCLFARWASRVSAYVLHHNPPLVVHRSWAIKL